jgi:hypothetical protein
MKNRNSRMREIAFHTLFCMVSMVSILLTMQKKYTSENDPLQAQITMREFQFFESIIEKIVYVLLRYLFSLMVEFSQNNDLKDFESRCTGDCWGVQPKCGGGW